MVALVLRIILVLRYTVRLELSCLHVVAIASSSLVLLLASILLVACLPLCCRV